MSGPVFIVLGGERADNTQYWGVTTWTDYSAHPAYGVQLPCATLKAAETLAQTLSTHVIGHVTLEPAWSNEDFKTMANPMNNLDLIHSLEQAVSALVKVSIANSWKGAQPPEDWAAIDQKLHDARGLYTAAVNALRVPPP